MTKLTYLTRLALWACVAAAATKDYGCPPEHVIKRDVVVIGGGSSGTYASIRLQQEGHSVAVVEKKHRLGGHVNTFVDPKTHKSFDIGVIFFENDTTTLNYMAHLGIDVVNAPFGASTTSFANFHTDGKIIKSLPESVPWTNQTALGEKLAEYVKMFDKFPFIANGINLPDPVPEDLYIPFGDFLKKHDLGAMVLPATSTCQGVGNILAVPTLYILKYFDQGVATTSLGGPPLLTTAKSDNQGIYDSALAKLGDDVLLKSTVLKIDRRPPGGGVEVLVSTPSGKRLIKAKKLLIATPPELKHLEHMNLDLDSEEKKVFGTLNNSYYWDMVISNSGLPDSLSFMPVDLAAPLALPATPIVQALSNPGIPGLTVGYYTSPHFRTDQEVKKDVLATLAKLVKANNFKTTGKPEFVDFHNHSPFMARVSSDQIRDGFYRTMNALQGQRDTFYTGAAWQTHNSNQIWNWSEKTLLPMLLKSLKEHK